MNLVIKQNIYLAFLYKTRKFQVNFLNHNLPKILSSVENKVAEISISLSTLTFYTQKLKVANEHIRNFFFSIKYQVLNLDIRIFLHFVVD